MPQLTWIALPTLPDTFRYVLVWISDGPGYFTGARYDAEFGEWLQDGMTDRVLSGITHWSDVEGPGVGNA